MVLPRSCSGKGPARQTGHGKAVKSLASTGTGHDWNGHLAKDKGRLKRRQGRAAHQHRLYWAEPYKRLQAPCDEELMLSGPQKSAF